VEEHLLPALYLPFQLGLQGVPLTQKEAVDRLLCEFSARRRSGLTRNVGYLAALMLLFFASFVVLSHEKRLLSLLTAPGIPRSCGAEPKKRRLEEASTRDAN
jgi:hypothetical protein